MRTNREGPNDATPPPGRTTSAALVRYAVVGLAQNGFLYLLTLGLLALGLPGWGALAITYPLGILVSFLLNRAWSFAGRRRMRGQFVRHVIVYLVVYPVTLGISWLLERVTYAWLATGLTIGIIAVAIFVAANLWVYPSHRATADETGSAPAPE